MEVRDILRRKGAIVETIAPEATLHQACEQMAACRIGCLVVSNDGARVDGILSERDIVTQVALRGVGVLERFVNDALTRQVITCAPGDDVVELMSVMTDRRCRHLPVVDAGRLVGIVSIGDLVKARIDAAETEAAALRDYITS
ncbi:MAG: CBS domain-containing protein [Alphaproteobacteria bacterium]